MNAAAVAVAATAAAALATVAASPLRFGFYSADLSQTSPYSNIFQAGNVTLAAQAWDQFKVPSLVLTYDAFFVSSPHRMVLAPNWEAQWDALATAAAPLVRLGH